jgi:zinc D-Ala-D-Ala carboxypeptidase
MYKSKYFKPSETACKCGCGLDLKQAVIDKLDKACDYAGFKLRINSGARCVAYNVKVGGVSNSAHTKCLASDIAFKDYLEMLKIITALTKVGFNRIGLNMTDKFIHADVDETLPTPAYWIYTE